MNTREVTVVAVVVLLGVAGAVLPTVAATTADAPAQADETNATATETNASEEDGNDSSAFGDQMTAFMQSSASETNDTVESGMWAAGFERANESGQARLATDHTNDLESRLDALREQNKTLTEQYENGTINHSVYVAQLSRLSGRIAALRTSINDTDRATKKAGVNQTRLDTLRNDARNMSGPQTAGVARGVVAGGQEPPDDRGGGPDATQGDGVGPNNETTNESQDVGDEANPSDSANDENTSTGGGNANPSDGGVGTGSDHGDSGETSSDEPTDGDDSDTGANPGKGNEASGIGNDGDKGDDAGGSGPNDVSYPSPGTILP